MVLAGGATRSLNSISFEKNKMLDHIIMLDKRNLSIYLTGK